MKDINKVKQEPSKKPEGEVNIDRINISATPEYSIKLVAENIPLDGKDGLNGYLAGDTNDPYSRMKFADYPSFYAVGKSVEGAIIDKYEITDKKTNTVKLTVFMDKSSTLELEPVNGLSPVVYGEFDTEGHGLLILINSGLKTQRVNGVNLVRNAKAEVGNLKRSIINRDHAEDYLFSKGIKINSLINSFIINCSTVTTLSLINSNLKRTDIYFKYGSIHNTICNDSNLTSDKGVGNLSNVNLNNVSITATSIAITTEKVTTFSDLELNTLANVSVNNKFEAGIFNLGKLSITYVVVLPSDNVDDELDDSRVYFSGDVNICISEKSFERGTTFNDKDLTKEVVANALKKAVPYYLVNFDTVTMEDPYNPLITELVNDVVRQMISRIKIIKSVRTLNQLT